MGILPAAFTLSVARMIYNGSYLEALAKLAIDLNGHSERSE
jgi:hypothetical protein